MAYDNVELDAGAGGAKVAVDTIATLAYQRVKVVTGGEGTATEISSANPVPVADAGGSLTVDQAGTWPVQATLQAGSAAFGKLAANSGVDIGDVDVTSVANVVPGVAATNLGKAIGTAVGPTDVGVALLAQRKDTLAAIVPADLAWTCLRVNSVGALHVTGASGTTQYAAGTEATATDSLVVPGFVRDDVLAALSDPEGDLVAGRVNSVGAQWVAVSNGIDGVADDAAFTVGTTFVLPAGFLADESSTDLVNEGDAGAARMTLDRKIIVNDQPHTAGGCSNYTALSTAAVLTAAIKASPGNLYSLEIFNVNAAARYVRLYNMTTAPASTDTASVVWQGVIPGATTGGGFVITWPKGKFFSTGIGIRSSTGIAHNDTGALGANELTFNASYA